MAKMVPNQQKIIASYKGNEEEGGKESRYHSEGRSFECEGCDG